MFFRQFWVDPRLTWGMVSAVENGNSSANGTASNGAEVQLYKRVDKSYNVAADMVDLLWLPDTFFIDEIGNSILSRDPVHVLWRIFGPMSGLSFVDQTVKIYTNHAFLDSRRHSIMTRNIFLEIHPNGYILLSERLTLKLKCPMHLRYYPFDLQICPIRAESYAFREDQVS